MRTSNKVSTILNFAILLAAALCVGVLVERFYFDRSPSSSYQVAPQARLTIEGVDWKQAERTLLVALAKNCRFCAESAPFYQRLVNGLVTETNTRVIALFPEKESSAESYLSDLAIPVKELRYAVLPSLGINDVPTLAILDREGVVTHMWIGKLPPRVEAEIMKTLSLTDTRPLSEWLIDEEKLRLRISNREPLVLVDVRDRAAFTVKHLDGARNIPMDELAVRAINELPATHTVVLYGERDGETDIAYRILEEQGFKNILILARP